jgi:hypothetical protein
MRWLTRNLFLVVVVLAALVLAAGGLAYMGRAYTKNDDLTTQLGAARQELNRLTSEVRPSPTLENVRQARADVKKAQEYSGQCRQFFTATPYQPMTSQSFRSMLETNIAALQRLAQASRVEIPTNYTFSFEPEIKPMTYEPASIRPLAEQVTEISEICRALFAARVQRLEQIRRVAVSQYDAGNSTEILQGITVTSNRFAGLTVWPYEFTLECFSGDLAAALEQLSMIPRMLLIKTITVEAAPPVPYLPNLLGVPADAPPVNAPGSRFARPGMPGPVQPAVAPKTPGLVTVLEEGALRVVMVIHVVKPQK